MTASAQHDLSKGAAAADPSNPERVGTALLAYLRARYSPEPISYAEPLTPIAIGVETWVYAVHLREGPAALHGPLVLRLFPPSAEPLCARFEQVVQNTVAELGYPAPRVLLVCEDVAVLGGPFLLMERVPGRMMLDSLFGGGNLMLHAPRLVIEALTRLPRTLADMQLRLHQLDGDRLRAALEVADVPARLYTIGGWLQHVQDRIEGAGLDGLRLTMEWLLAHQPAEAPRPVICHCDFLPPNLLVEGDTLHGVIDWSHTTLADAAWDVANTRLRLAMNPFEAPRALLPVIAGVRRRVTRVYEARYRAQRPVDAAAVRYYEVLLGLWMLATVAEHRIAQDAPGADGRGANPWMARGATRPLERYCRAVTGLELFLPPPTD